MTNKQRAKKDSYDRIANFNSRHQALLSAIDGYTAEQHRFDAALQLIEAATGLQISGPLKDAATIKAEKWQLAKLVVRMAGKAAVKAGQAGMPDLARLLSFSPSTIRKLPHGVAVQKCIHIRGLIREHGSVLTNITAADMQQLDDAIQAFDTARDAPVEHIRNRKALGTGALPAAFAAADLAMHNLFKLVDSSLPATYAAEFASAKMILDTGLRHTKLLFTVLDAASLQPVAGAAVVQSGGLKRCVSAANGEALLERIRNGRHVFEVMAAGYISTQVTAMAKRGREVDVEVRLTAVLM